MPNISSFGAQTDNAVVQGTVTDRQMIIPEVPPQGLMSVGPRVTPNFVRPREWNAQTTYHFFDAVRDNAGNAYVATKPVVPKGTPLTDEDYWFLWADPDTRFDELNEIVSNFNSELTAIKNKYLKVYATVADMQSDKKLTSGMIVKTNGFYANGDGGGAFYITTDETSNNMDVIKCVNTNMKYIAQKRLNISSLGAKGDGVSDDKKYINRAIEIAEDGAIITGAQGKTYKANYESTPVSINNKLTFENISFNLTGSLSVFSVESDHVSFINCDFYDGSQIIYLDTCNYIRVEGCTFTHTGYDIIQKRNKASSHVIVTNNMIIDSYHDFVECDSREVCSDWIITNNQFTGALNYASTSDITENRFAGFTCVDNIIIANNYINNVPGDAAIHFEYITGKFLIQNNTFNNCRGEAIVTLWQNDINGIIDGNIFDGEYKFAVYVNYNNTQTYDLNVCNNTFTNNVSFNTLFLYDNEGRISIKNNTFKNCNMTNGSTRAVNAKIIVDGNTFNGKNFIYTDALDATAVMQNCIITNNTVTTSSDYAIKAVSSDAGTHTKNVVITNNVMNKGIKLYYPELSNVMGNCLDADATVEVETSGIDTFYKANNTSGGKLIA